MSKITREQIIALKELEYQIALIEKQQGFTTEVEEMLYVTAEFCIKHNINPEEHTNLCYIEQAMQKGLLDGRACHGCKYCKSCQSYWKTHRMVR